MICVSAKVVPDSVCPTADRRWAASAIAAHGARKEVFDLGASPATGIIVRTAPNCGFWAGLLRVERLSRVGHPETGRSGSGQGEILRGRPETRSRRAVGLAFARSCPGLARVMSPAAIFERPPGVDVFGEGLLAVVMLHEGLRSVGMVHDGPRPVVHDILPAADSRPEKRDLLRISMGSRIPITPASIRMTPTACKSRSPMCPPFKANVRTAPRTIKAIPTATEMTRHPFGGWIVSSGSESVVLPAAVRHVVMPSAAGGAAPGCLPVRPPA